MEKSPSQSSDNTPKATKYVILNGALAQTKDLALYKIYILRLLCIFLFVFPKKEVNFLAKISKISLLIEKNMV